MAFDPSIGRGTQWKKGQSGNAGGRPKSRMLSEAFRARLAEVVPGDRRGRTYAELIAENVVEIALGEGSAAIAAANEIADRIEGRATQSIQVSDLVADLQSRSDEELTFHLAKGRWPTEEEKVMLTGPTPHPTA